MTKLPDLRSDEFRNLKAVLLDLDNTFYAYDPCHEYALGKVYEHFKELSDWSFETYRGKYKVAQEVIKDQTGTQAASHSRLLYFQVMLEQLFQRSKPSKALALEKIYWDNFLTKMVLRDDILTFTLSAHTRGLKICIVTDLTTRIQMEKICHLGIEDQIDILVSSEEAGADKPDSAIFNLALKKLAIKASEAIMIGDSPAKDIAGAEAVGIKSFLIE